MLRRLFRDRKGSAAVEFALIAPLMILFYAGMAELTQAMLANRRAAHVAAVVGDLVAQAPQINTAQMNDIFYVGNAIIAPFPSTKLGMRITSIKADGSGNPSVVWSKTQGPLSVLSGKVTTLPAGFLAANESVIMAETTYTYDPEMGTMILKSGLNFSEKLYLRPRKTAEVVWSTS
jgi:Flp pilus assembly protein TadG